MVNCLEIEKVMLTVESEAGLTCSFPAIVRLDSTSCSSVSGNVTVPLTNASIKNCKDLGEAT